MWNPGIPNTHMLEATFHQPPQKSGIDFHFHLSKLILVYLTDTTQFTFRNKGHNGFYFPNHSEQKEDKMEPLEACKTFKLEKKYKWYIFMEKESSILLLIKEIEIKPK